MLSEPYENKRNSDFKKKNFKIYSENVIWIQSAIVYDDSGFFKEIFYIKKIENREGNIDGLKCLQIKI